MQQTPPPLAPSPKQRRLARYLSVTFLLFWIPALLFLILANIIRSGSPLPGDIAILQWLNGFSHPFADQFFLAITHLGGVFVVLPVLLAAVTYLYLKNRRFAAIFLLFSAGGTAGINLVLKYMFARSRPDLWEHLVTETGYSFPSGHAMISSTVALTAIVLLWHTSYRWLAVAIGSIYFLLVSISRLYLGVHYPSDIIAGWSVSLLWVVFLYTLFCKFRKPSVPKQKVLDDDTY